MTCAEYRDLWTELNGAKERGALSAHTLTCAACASWTAQSDTLDDVFEDALLVAPPPAVAARLREIALTLPAPAPSPTLWWHYLPEVLVVAFLALGLLGLGGETSAALGSFVAERVGNVLQAGSVFFDPPLVGYLASLWGTLLEACAALLLLAVLISHALSYPTGRSME